MEDEPMVDAPTPVTRACEGVTYVDSLPEEMLMLLFTALHEVELCRLSTICSRFHVLLTSHSMEPLWAALHQRRWYLPLDAQPLSGSWRLEYIRRHEQDMHVEPLLHGLLTPQTRSEAWRQLLGMGDEIYDRVLEVADREPMDPHAAGLSGLPAAPGGGGAGGSVSSEAWKTLRALNQTAVRREWEALKEAAALRQSSRSGGREAGGEPFVEQGALLLVRFYTGGQDLRTPHAKVKRVEAELSGMGERLAARLEQGFDAVQAVRTLSEMLFTEEGFAGNQHNYYDFRNSLLDHVLGSHTGIPISLSVIFAAVCRRVGVDLDMIGLPGHFLLATRPRHPAEARVFVDAFHGGSMLGLQQCEQIVRSYGIRWSDDMATPVQVGEVCDRMVRNLLNCHKQTGDMMQARIVQNLLPRENPQVPPPPLPYPSAEATAHEEHLQPSPAMLMQMLQNMLQMQQQP